MRRVRISVNLKPSLLDSQGQAICGSLRTLGFTQVQDVRVGKTIELQLAADADIKAMCDQLLANPVIEDYVIEEIA